MTVEIPRIVEDLRAAFNSGRTRPAAWRRTQLEGLQRFIVEQQAAIFAALAEDLGKPEVEAWSGETNMVLTEISHTLKHLRRWMRPEKVSTPMVTQPGSSRIMKEPLGVVLIIAPWNYPLQLALSPLVGAIAAGNCAVVKPSEISAATSRLIAEQLPKYLDPECVQVIEGGVEETTVVLAQRFDHIFYTGNGHVGRIVMAAAAKHLTPVVLELGGKSPCIVDQSADIEVAARRIVWGRFYNAGQTCVAPDYVLAHRSIYEALIEAMAKVVVAFFGEDPKQSPDYARIVNVRHLRRLVALLEGQDAVVGGDYDEATRYLAPTILRDVSRDAAVMGEEIFGPILPVLKVDDIDEAIQVVNEGDKPLALYVFAKDTAAQEAVLGRTSSGGACVNHVLMHLTVPDLPFGGVGESGMGSYHGKASFDCFSHRKSVLKKPFAMDPPIMYPPYTEKKLKWLKRLL